MNGLSDGQLLEFFASRDGETAEQAFAVLVERHGPMVHRVCRRLMGSAHDADDAFQATFLILARRAEAIRRRDSVGSWLFGVALKVASSDRAARNRRRERELQFGQRWQGERGGTATEEFDRSELAFVVLEEVGRLPERYRAAVVLCDLEGLGHEEAAKQLGCPVGTVKSRQARGRERLRGRLSHRGLAPSETLSALLLFTESGQAALRASFADSTVRLAIAARMAQAAAAGVVPVAIETLAEGVLRTMFLMKLKVIGVIVLLTVGLVAAGGVVHAYQGVAPEQPRATFAGPDKKEPARVGVSDAGLLIVTGTILMPDGKPAIGATMTWITGTDEMATVARADESGRFRLEGLFGNGARLHARSADGSHQAVRAVSADAVRTTFDSPVEFRLTKSMGHRVSVLAEGRPAEGVLVAASGTDFQVDGVTGRDGQVVLRLPAGGRLNELVAWHPELGVNGLRNLEDGLKGGPTQLTLRPPGPHRIVVIDAEGKPVRDLELAMSVQTEDSDWIMSDEIDAARVRTDAEGIARLTWLPLDKLKYIDIKVLSRGWKEDETDRKQIAAGVTTLRVRRERDVQGRLEMPEGANPEGILISGFGFGPSSNGDIPYARVRRDGSFTLRVPSEHAYVLGIADLKWASDPWTGVILGRDSWKPADVTMRVYPATSIMTRVLRGPRREPVVDAWLEVGFKSEVKWVDAKGENRSGNAGPRTLAQDRRRGRGAGWGGSRQTGISRGFRPLGRATRDQRRLRQADRDRVPSPLDRSAAGQGPPNARRGTVRAIRVARGPRLVAARPSIAARVRAYDRSGWHGRSVVRCALPFAVRPRS
jgi:RNA polymerase sigma factor (sigma-70 family)